MSIKGRIGGGINDAFVRLSSLKLTAVGRRQPLRNTTRSSCSTRSRRSPSARCRRAVMPTAVIDHHRARGRKPQCAFCDIRTDVGATSSIIFSYFMELEVPIRPELGATLLYAIESDLAGAAGTPGELDNIALSSLTLIADLAQAVSDAVRRSAAELLPRLRRRAGQRGLFRQRAMSLHIEYDRLAGKAGGHRGLPAALRQGAVGAGDGGARGPSWSSACAPTTPRLSAGEHHVPPDPQDRRRRRPPHQSRRVHQAGNRHPSPRSSDCATVLKRRYLRALGIKSPRGQKLVPDVKKVEPAKLPLSSGRGTSSGSYVKLAASPGGQPGIE